VIKLGKEKLSKTAKKNLLDLNHDKYLQYFNTSIIITFTYVVGMAIAFFTKQIDYNNPNQLFLLGVISIAFLGLISLLLFKFKDDMENIKAEIRRL